MTRKYRQPGYQDEQPEKRPKRKRSSTPPELHSKQMPGFQEIARCTMCGAKAPHDIQTETQCSQCKTHLHSCRHCVFFDTSARYECTQELSERVNKKDIGNNCNLFVAKKTIERMPTSIRPATPKPKTARQAFDDLFKS